MTRYKVILMDCHLTELTLHAIALPQRSRGIAVHHLSESKPSADRDRASTRIKIPWGGHLASLSLVVCQVEDCGFRLRSTHGERVLSGVETRQNAQLEDCQPQPSAVQPKDSQVLED